MNAPTYHPGTVVRYTPIPMYPNGDARHCREGLAIADRRGVLVDTFWRGIDSAHRVNDAEAPSIKVIANLNDYQRLDRNARAADYHPRDRLTITRQHGLVREEYVREGATPHLGTRIVAQVERVREAERALAAATRDVEWAREKLERIIAERTTPADRSDQP